MRLVIASVFALCCVTARAQEPARLEVARDGALRLDAAPITSEALAARLGALPRRAAPLRVAADGDLPWALVREAVASACPRGGALEAQSWSVLGDERTVAWLFPIEGLARELPVRWVARIELSWAPGQEPVAKLRWGCAGGRPFGLPDHPDIRSEGPLAAVLDALGEVPEVSLGPDDEVPLRVVHAAGLEIRARLKGRLWLSVPLR